MRNKHHMELVFPVFLILHLCTEMAMSQNTTIPVKVGVILDNDTELGKMGLSCINMSLSDFYASHSYYKTRLVLNARDSKSDVVGAAAAALDLIKNIQVQAIIGTQNSMQATFVIDLGDKANVPIISFSASSPSLTSLRSSYFFRATTNDSSQVKAISAVVQAYGWREAVPIYVDNDFGEGVIPYLTDALQQIDTSVPYRSVISPSATDDQIGEELYKLMTMETRVFIVHMAPSLGSRLFAKATEIGMMSEGYVWIITDAMANVLSTMDHSAIDSMQGVLGVNAYVPRTNVLDNFMVRWKLKFQQDNPTIVDAQLTVYGLWAYDAAQALAMAVERLGTTSFGFNNKNISSNSSTTTDLDSFGVSQNGPNLIKQLSSSKFVGLTGDYYFLNGQLQSSAFQIINVNGNGGRRVGFWTPENGLIKKLSSANTNASYSISKANLGPILWPGDSTSVPKGWEIPTNGKKLQIGVPVKTGFAEFVKVTRDNSTNTITATGFCIDVFQAVIQALPYAVPYEFIPFENPTSSYNDLLYQVYLRNFDAVVGDATIVANRSLYVDFTLPYTESGVSMVVPIKYGVEKNAWIFLKPLTLELWVTTACSFIFIGFVVWALEHRINEDFHGPPSYQVSTSLWFSFSIMVFAQREKVVSSLARFVVIVFFFVVLIITQSYTASLTSLLTVQQLQPTVTDIQDLIKNGDYVGYQEGSFMLGILKGWGFQESKLVSYESIDQCHELFILGSGNGGIAAAIDEVPYMRLFLAQYCSEYTMVQSVLKTDGFGFAFPINSPLVPDVSRAVLNVTEGDKMKEIEAAWFHKLTSCRDTSSSTITSSNLGLESFWGLFLMAVVASFSALIIYAAMFLYSQRKILTLVDPNASIWRRILDIIKNFVKKDFRSLTSGKSDDDIRDRSGINDALTNLNNPPSPTSYTNQTDFGEQGTPTSGIENSINTNNHPSPSNCTNHSDIGQGTPSTEIDYAVPFVSDQASAQTGSAIELTNNPDQKGAVTVEIGY
ncbi:Lig_chan domain-containing protein/SBP_bac_3 domain-containing protein/ANF_receptor domain-containing protein [Cephalotus follicularis]|uniref:Lig_chan domain-containing protein/SBP_bac_3 domain-containing protein/ANF_receptor domain-containing protein n=1 Tax=Cephalotus follicularis TaxID=3775 RepID=A0A1Q3CCN5_CEPFO|nr:Lig_chan domain-containing protein/SBP_bac_3 domain-containing protein/ANF_receptor domain-containing protein [Cephalotus follicularis]